MQIYINQEKMDITLDKEKNLAEVISGIEIWLNEGNMVLTSIQLNGENTSPDSEKDWSSYKTENIRRLDLTASPMEDMNYINMETVYQFLTLLKKLMENRSESLKKELSAGYPYMIQSMSRLMETLTEEKAQKAFLQFIALASKHSPESLVALKDEETQSFLLILDPLLTTLSRTLEDLKNPLGALKALTERLKESSANLSEVSVLLQTGKDKDAMNFIIEFTEQLQKALTLLTQLNRSGQFDFEKEKIAGRKANEFYTEFNEFLNELTEAFNAGDFVLIGDLLEYEVAPRLEELAEFTEQFEMTGGCQ